MPAAAVLPLAVRGGPPDFGPAAVVRDLLGRTGVTAAAAALVGARPSRLPASGYVGAVHPASRGARGHAVAVWAWPVQPAAAAWAAAGRVRAGGGPVRRTGDAAGDRPRLTRHRRRTDGTG
ncbi:hypothetical protein [Streptomyces antibioticus]|uniref:hypothetical protein n=1 Tax=Streptomyces antibioticus TaxID=1890 RepID=UPI003D7593C2